tara:strand:+ start:685 stop:1377 length:693 start_codon:yes stop_codon:yes gene_type:complete
MAYLDNSTITVDAILTKKGRERLSSGGKGQNGFQITQFALGDDEIDYSLWDPTHADGTSAYGTVIENTPMFEAVSDETQIMRSKLLTLPKGTPKVPILDIAGIESNALTLTSANQTEFVIAPTTTNIAGADTTLGYTFILHDGTLATIDVIDSVSSNLVGTVPSFLGDITQQYTVSEVGLSVKLKVKTVVDSVSTEHYTKLTIIGNETGATKTIDLTVVSQTETGTRTNR